MGMNEDFLDIAELQYPAAALPPASMVGITTKFPRDVAASSSREIIIPTNAMVRLIQANHDITLNIRAREAPV